MTWKRILLLVVVPPILGLGIVVFAPVDALERRASEAEDLAVFEERTAEHFARIDEGDGLDLPFPAMKMRPENPATPERVELGRLLYFDPILSGDDTLSCAHCHHPDLGFSDNRGLSMGKGGTGLGPDRRDGAALRRGSPTVWNAAYNHLQFWDGRADDLEDQAAKPIMDPNEMAEEPPRLEKQLRAIPEYVERFAEAFPGDGEDAVSFENVTFAISAFERTILSRDSAFDRYARGDREALGPAERRGLNVFRSLKTRCFECHNLPTFANPDFKVVGVPDADLAKHGLEAPDLGRAEIEGGAPYERAFKVPTLRNVALTAPYMHGGQFDTLSEVIDFYAGGGGAGAGMDLPNLDDKIRPFELSEQEKSDLIAFLHALTDESAKPEFPESVPSGLPVVPRLENRSPEMDAFEPPQETRAESTVTRGEDGVIRVGPGQVIQHAIDLAQPGDVIEIEPGVYHETLTLDVSDLTLRGLERGGLERDGPGGVERAVLDGRGELSDGVIGSGSRLVLENFDVRRYTANGLMINLGEDVTFRNLGVHDTGLYGVYPVEVVGVLVEGTTVTGVKDAGIYVGQSKDVVVRGNVVHGNVTGIEIENSLDALVTENEVYDNAGGILVFGLPNVPSKLSRGCRVIGNVVRENNHENFGDPTAIVSKVPSGTGILVLAGDEVEIRDNEIVGNDSFGVGVASLRLLFPHHLSGGRFDVDPYPDGVLVADNVLRDNGGKPAPMLADNGFPGADLLWDLSGEGNAWSQPDATSLPVILPGPEWGTLRRRANYRVWSLLSSLADVP